MLRNVRARVRRRLGGASSEPGCPSNPDTAVMVSVEPAALAALSAAAGAQSPRKVGVLVKYTNAFKGWKPRLFTLDTGILTYVSSGSSPGSNSGPNSFTHREKSFSQSPHVDRANGHCDILSDSPSTSPVSMIADNATSPDRSKSGRDGNSLDYRTLGRKNDTVHLSRGEKRRRLRRRIGTSTGAPRHGSTENIPRFDRDVKGWINVQLAVITSDDSDSLRFAIDTGEDIYHLKAATPAERDEWVQALNESKRYFSSVVEKVALRSSRASFAQADAMSPEVDMSDTLKNSNQKQLPSDDCAAQIINSPTVEAQLEVAGLSEAAVARKTLAAELKRVCSVLEAGGSVEDVFREEPDQEPPDESHPEARSDARTGLLDLASLALHVLQTDTMLLERNVNATAKLVAIQSGGPLSYRQNGHLSDSDASDEDLVYFDALSRTASCRTNALSSASQAAELAGPDDMACNWMNDADIHMVDASMHSPEEKHRKLARVDTVRLSSIAGHAIRSELPQIAGPQPKLNIWNILKDSVGKDLSKISLPVALNEPLSFLQRLAEDIEYSELLDQAAVEPDPYRRLLLVATMVVSHYSSTQSRTGKPFNPLLGETYALVMPHKGNGVRFVAEQVSHHPPISACYAEGSGGMWKYYNALEVRNKFWGKSLEVFPTGWNHIEIPGFGDRYEFEQVTSCVHNIVVGKMWLDNYGEMDIVNRTTGDHCVIKFQKSGWLSDAKSLGTVSGIVYDAQGVPRRRLSGRWVDSIYDDTNSRQCELLWQVRSRPPPTASNSYNMTQWAISLNQAIDPKDMAGTAPTDSRFRPDQRALEIGEYEQAGRLKNMLEEGQRVRRQALESAGKEWQPLWFTLATDPDTNRSEYHFNGRYFQASAESRWEGVPDLFSCARVPGRP